MFVVSWCVVHHSRHSLSLSLLMGTYFTLSFCPARIAEPFIPFSRLRAATVVWLRLAMLPSVSPLRTVTVLRADELFGVPVTAVSTTLMLLSGLM